MPRELVAIAPRTPLLRHYDEPPLQPYEIRIRTELASPKHGTELVEYRDDPVALELYDPLWAAVIRNSEKKPRERFPLPLGNMAVGTVTEVGAEVTHFRVGDHVFGHFPIRETQTIDQTFADPLPPGLSPEAVVCLDPLVMAFAIRDGGIKLGDRVAVFGLGAIGLFAVQLARLAGASVVIALDPIENRRKLALELGADIALDPMADGGDAGLAIRQLTAQWTSPPDSPMEETVTGGYLEFPTQRGNLGVDVAVETSGSIPALQQAVRATRFGGTIGVVSFYGRDAAGLMLGEEFHMNRLQIVSLRSETLPMRDAPAWTLDRMTRVGLDWLVQGRIRTEGILTPIVPFEESVDAFRMIDECPWEAIKLGVRFS